MTELYETFRQPPASIESEVCVLGSMILDQNTIPAIAEVLQAEDFFRPAHQEIFRAIQTAYSRAMMHPGSCTVDIVIICEELIAAGKLDAAGGKQYIVDIVDGVPTAANAMYYAGVVRDKSILRRLIVAGGEIVRRAYANIETGESLLGELAEQTHSLNGRIEVVQDIEASTTEVCEAAASDTAGGLPLGVASLDFQLGGLRPGNYCILAARPGRGKTTLALCVASSLCQRDRPVIYFTREMTQGELIARAMCSLSGVSGTWVRSGRQPMDVCQRLAQAKSVVDYWPMEIDSRASTVVQIASAIRRFTARKRQAPVLAIIDYFQLLNGPGKSRYEKFSEISTQLKAMAMLLKLPILVLSQFNRPEKGKENERPTMYQLKETGSLEQDADQVILMHCAEVDHHGSNNIELCLDKNRHGPESGWGRINLTWQPQFYLMEDRAY